MKAISLKLRALDREGAEIKNVLMILDRTSLSRFELLIYFIFAKYHERVIVNIKGNQSPKRHGEQYRFSDKAKESLSLIVFALFAYGKFGTENFIYLQF